MAKFTLDDLLKEIKVETKVAAEKEEGAAVDSSREKNIGKLPGEAQVGKELDHEAKITPEEIEENEIGKSQEPSSPVDDAIEMSGKLAAMEKEILFKEAEMIGRAIIDGALSRVSDYEKVASSNMVKQAEEAEYFEKVAEAYNSDPDFKASFDYGYQDTLGSFKKGMMDKTAEVLEQKDTKESFVHGVLSKTAEYVAEKEASFSQGFMDKIAEQIQSNPEAMKAFTAGYEKTAQEIIKVAEHMTDKGYVEMAQAISKIS